MKKILFLAFVLVCPLMLAAQTTLTGKVVATPNTNWTPAYVYYDLAEVATTLGYADAAALAADLTAAFTGEAHTIEIANVDNNDTESTNYTANYWRLFGEEWKQVSYGCFWLNADNEVVNYGSGNILWSQTDWNTETGKLIIGLGQMAYQNDDTGCAPGSYTAKTKLANGANSIVLESTLIVEATQESALTIINEGTVYVHQTAHASGDWSSDYKWYWFDNSAFLAAGATTEFITDNIASLLFTSDGTSLVNTHNTSGNGFWFKGTNNTPCVKATDTQEFYVDHLICNNESWIGFNIGQGYGNLSAGDHREATLFIIYGTLAVKLNIVFDVVNYSIANDNAVAPTTGDDLTIALSGRTLKAGWNTMVLPFDITATQMAAVTGTSVELATMTSATAETIQFTKVESVAANTPFLINVDADVKNLVFTGVDVTSVVATPTAAGSAFDFVGSYTTTTAPEDSYVLTTGNVFKRVGDAGKTVNACRAYLSANGAGVKAGAVAITFVDGETAVMSIEQKSHDHAFYNLAGQRVRQATKGIFIQDGRKVAIK